MTADYTSIPELAGVATYAQAARVGYTVDDNVDQLLRLHWTEWRLMRTLLTHLPSTPIWEAKCAFALHQWYCAVHADALRTRVREMRSPVPLLDRAPDAALDAFLDELLRAEDAVELVAGIYDVAFPALREAYAEHAALANPLVDHPTRWLLRRALPDHDEAIEWGATALEALVKDDALAGRRADAWRAHLSLYLSAAGGIAGDTPRPMRLELPPSRSSGPFTPDMHPRRDERFSGLYNFNFPPHLVYNDETIPADERNLALLCKRALEMDVPEMIASVLVERDDQPWEFHLDYSRQLWDETRHAMMGTVALQSRGLDWTKIPLNVGFSLRLNVHASPVERQILLYAIEQSLMPATTGKRTEYETARAAGDELSAHFHDYDWADEVLHASIGRRALKREKITVAEAVKRAQEIHGRTWEALNQYRHLERQDAGWWGAFVRVALGRESAWQEPEKDESPPRVLAE